MPSLWLASVALTIDYFILCMCVYIRVRSLNHLRSGRGIIAAPVVLLTNNSTNLAHTQVTMSHFCPTTSVTEESVVSVSRR